MEQKIFEELAGMMPDGMQIKMVLKKKDDKMTILFVPDMTDSSTNLAPLNITHSPEDMDEAFLSDIRDFKAPVLEYASSIKEAKLAAAAKAAENKAKASGKTGKAKANTVELEKRKIGEVDEQDVSTLSTVPATDGNFTSAVKRASKATLEAALKKPINLTNIKAVTAELAKLTDKTAKELQIEVLSAKHQAAENGNRDKIGESLIKISGKTLEELGLAPKQASLLG